MGNVFLRSGYNENCIIYVKTQLSIYKENSW